ncbi:hypothetical protein N9O61_02850 [Octadecabacter sp.]|nr:hypothetical protein [Octadecabacter sp.]
MAAPITLESFDNGTPIPIPESPDYKRGYQQGLTEAQTLTEKELLAAVSELSATLTDLSFGYEEALQHVLSKLSPLMSQISEHVVPEVLSNTFGLHLAEMLKDAVATECEGGFQVLVSPETATLLQSAEQASSMPCDILASSDLVAGQALLSCGEASDQVLDLPALTNALKTALQGIDQKEWSRMNG